ncbi:DoxX family protein [Rouxiella badensis]|jgi:putative oxidoreductase|uniref:DoxX family protein n=1 Tax=Rouxiella badensis TaxID=1646377 RepID=UPI00035F3814|nr:DoxX family protein [Rouxiella badensis]MCC3701641.1 DoxX family protein [Rouxiella badensis]MCC3719341.1 DoxX family protein [Rouxiella badensis]MCC3728591.1 DoxX family protein [Rouxiella badensis]MCC3735524.1 DoxX family protein [Rouxiella badensis]MCC3739413.1 DoxX family protein [Rouxiella badensis]
MRYFSVAKYSDVIILVARVLLMLLFVIFGLEKITGFSGTVTYMSSVGAPFPTVAAIIAVVMEFFVGIALILGFYTRPLALIMAVYTLATGLIGHPFWGLTGAAHYANEINFYKNIAIVGGLLLLAVTGPGKFSLDRK